MRLICTNCHNVVIEDYDHNRFKEVLEQPQNPFCSAVCRRQFKKLSAEDQKGYYYDWLRVQRTLFVSQRDLFA